MIREQINLYIEPLLSLVPIGDKGQSDVRYQLIEEGISSDDFVELIRQWMVVHDLDQSAALALKTWFSLSYARLGEILNMSPKEVSQLIRSLRTQQLPTYPPVSKSLDSEAIAGLSCFMVEQSLSAWLDSEIQDTRTVESIHQHLAKCSDCSNRLSVYRDLHRQVLAQRKHWPAVTEREWTDALEKMSQRRRRFIHSSLIYVAIALLTGAIVAGFIWSRPEETPNIYEIGN